MAMSEHELKAFNTKFPTIQQKMPKSDHAQVEHSSQLSTEGSAGSGPPGTSLLYKKDLHFNTSVHILMKTKYRTAGKSSQHSPAMLPLAIALVTASLNILLTNC